MICLFLRIGRKSKMKGAGVDAGAFLSFDNDNDDPILASFPAGPDHLDEYRPKI